MDKTTLDLITIIIAAIGVFMAVKKYSPPEQSMAFYGTNPFLLKKDIIETWRAGVFVLFAIIGLLIQIVIIIFFPTLQKRIHTNKYYVFSFILILVVMLVVAFFLNWLAKFIAKKKWQPKLVESLKKGYMLVSEIIENGGLERKQLYLKEKERDLTEIIQNNYQIADQRLERIEKLLDIRRKGKSREKRIKSLSKFFKE